MTQTLKSLLRGVLWIWRSHFAKSKKKTMLAAMYRVKFTAFKRHGICREFYRHCRDRDDDTIDCNEELWRLFALWPKFSGRLVYPIPGAGATYWAAQAHRTMWSGEYGNLRKELLNFMIEQLEKELAE